MVVFSFQKFCSHPPPHVCCCGGYWLLMIIYFQGCELMSSPIWYVRILSPKTSKEGATHYKATALLSKLVIWDYIIGQMITFPALRAYLFSCNFSMMTWVISHASPPFVSTEYYQGMDMWTFVQFKYKHCV